MKNNFTCIIVDDEPKSIGLLTECLCSLYNNIEIVGAYTSWTTALPALRTKECDLLFLDVSMPGKTGIELLGLLHGIDYEIIFITAHSEFALNAFKFSPSGYVLKPIDDRELTTAVDKAIERIQYRKLAKLSSQPSFGSKIGIPNNKGIEYLNIDDIVYLEAKKSCTRVVTSSAEIISSYSLNRFRPIVEKHSFFQVHRSYIANLDQIKRYVASGIIVMTNGDELPVSKSEREDFLLKFDRVSKSD